jgi:hypothetical protein
MMREAVAILGLAPPHPMVDYWLAYLARDDAPAESRARLEKALQGSPRLVYPFRDEDLPVLAWALERNPHWKTRYYLALTAWSHGLQDEALARFRECGADPDFGAFYLTRAELFRKSGRTPPVEDYRRALDLAPEEWRTWLALARYYSEQASFRECLEAAEKGFGKFPDNFILGMEYVRALIDSSRYTDALEVLDRLIVLPYENASEGRQLYEKAHLLEAGRLIHDAKYEEALVHIAKSREWPEHLGAGKPYDPDERLQDFLEGYCSSRLGRAAARQADPASLRTLEAGLKRSAGWKYDLLAAILRGGTPRTHQSPHLDP